MCFLSNYVDALTRLCQCQDVDSCAVFAAKHTHRCRALSDINERLTTVACVGIAVLSSGAAPTDLGNT